MPGDSDGLFGGLDKREIPGRGGGGGGGGVCGRDFESVGFSGHSEVDVVEVIVRNSGARSAPRKFSGFKLYFTKSTSNRRAKRAEKF